MKPGALGDKLEVVTDSESRSLDLYTRLQEVLGTGPATTLMSKLEHSQSRNLVTQDQFTAFTKGEFQDFKTEMGEFKAEMHGFKTEMGDFKTEMSDFKTEMGGFKTEMGEFKTEMREFKTVVALRFERVDAKFDAVNQRIDRVLLAVVAGQVALFAAIFGAAALF